MCEENKSSNVVSFGLGAVLGAGAGAFLSTKKGRKLLKKAWRQIEPYIGDTLDSAKDELEDVKEKAGKMKAKAENELERTFTQVKDIAEEKIPPSIKKPIKKTFFRGV